MAKLQMLAKLAILLEYHTWRTKKEMFGMSGGGHEGHLHLQDLPQLDINPPAISLKGKKEEDLPINQFSIQQDVFSKRDSPEIQEHWMPPREDILEDYKEGK